MKEGPRIMTMRKLLDDPYFISGQDWGLGEREFEQALQTLEAEVREECIKIVLEKRSLRNKFRQDLQNDSQRNPKRNEMILVLSLSVVSLAPGLGIVRRITDADSTKWKHGERR